jgi:YHS domain-containing protein
MIRFLLLSILLTILFRAVSRLWTGIVRGMQGQDAFTVRGHRGSGVPQRGVQMARDPICGTFVVPERAVALSVAGGERLYFCSTTCRDTYRANTSTQSSAATAQGRTA